MAKQILPSSTIRNITRTVRRMCMLILGLTGLTRTPYCLVSVRPVSLSSEICRKAPAVSLYVGQKMKLNKNHILFNKILHSVIKSPFSDGQKSCKIFFTQKRFRIVFTCPLLCVVILKRSSFYAFLTISHV